MSYTTIPYIGTISTALNTRSSLLGTATNVLTNVLVLSVDIADNFQITPIDYKRNGVWQRYYLDAKRVMVGTKLISHHGGIITINFISKTPENKELFNVSTAAIHNLYLQSTIQDHTNLIEPTIFRNCRCSGASLKSDIIHDLSIVYGMLQYEYMWKHTWLT